MLAALAELRKEAGFVLYCAHVEHGIRPAAESRGDAQAVEALCGKLDVPCRVIAIPRGRITTLAGSGGPGIEAAARVYRLRALFGERRRLGAESILIAHTRDDLLETLLMRILRGAGPAGLAAMPRTRGRILRPLLDLGRKDVLAYLEERGLPFRTDSTNADIRFLRNRVRLKLIPLLDSFFPSWRNSLLVLAETQSLTAEFLASEAGRRLPWEETIPEGDASLRLGEVSLRLKEADFLAAPSILREEAIFAGTDMLAAMRPKGKACKRLQGQVPRRLAVRRSVGLLAEGQVTAKHISARDLGPVRLQERNGYIELVPAVQAKGERGFSLLIKEAGFYTLEGRILGMGKRASLCIEAEISPSNGDSSSAGNPIGFSAAFPLVLRNHRGRDRIYRGGHRRRFSDILDRKACSEYTEIITACNSKGPVAFIGVGRCGELLVFGGDIKTDVQGAGAAASFFFKVSFE